MVNINSFKLFTESLSNKIQIGNTLTVDQFNQFANQAQFVKYEEDRNIFIAKNEISFYLSTFLKNYTGGVPTNGMLPYPSDLEHIASVRSYYVPPDGFGLETPVQSVRNADWGKVASSQLLIPTKEFPKYSWFDTSIRFLPRNIGIIMLDYFKTPQVPNWGFTILNGRPVYDPTTSVDFEFDEFALNSVAAIFLKLVAVQLKDAELMSFAMQFEQQTNTPV